MTALPSPVGCVKATWPFRGSNGHPWMNVSAAADSSLLAIPCRRWDEETKMRGIPSGVGRGVGWQNRLALMSTSVKPIVRAGCSGECILVSFGEAIIIAVEIRCATTHPAIFSRAQLFVGDRRNRYTFDACKIDGVRGGEDKARLTVFNRIPS